MTSEYLCSLWEYCHGCQMKLAHGPLDAGYTKSHIQGHALSSSVGY